MRGALRAREKFASGDVSKRLLRQTKVSAQKSGKV
jgi:hypothetical protein